MIIKSPLGAIGAIIVLIQAVAASALFAVESRPVLQSVLVGVIVAVTAVFSILVIWLIVHLVRRHPGLLFDPSSISQSIHKELYVSDEEKISAVIEVIDGGDSASRKTPVQR